MNDYIYIIFTKIKQQPLAEKEGSWFESSTNKSKISMPFAVFQHF